MKKLIFTVAIAMATLQLFAQEPVRARVQATPAAIPPPVDLREVSGVVKDAKGETVIGATVFLKSTKDSIKTVTNEDGIFVFRNVKMATFVVTVSGMGLKTITRKYLQNDAVKRIVLDPIEAKDESNLLKEVTINGTPSVVYKTDTVEYRASDYKVRANATVDEVLKKMEGMEVGNDGTVTFQGQAVPQVKLNGKTFSGGNVAQAIQNLPADIVDKIQVVDDYGDQAARTGVKDGDPTKTLNITTQADKSVGTTGRVTLQAGNDNRYNGQVSIQRINGNQQLSLIGRVQKTVTGIASSGASGGGRGPGAAGNSGGGNPGTSLTANPSFSYRDQWSPKLQVIGNYSYNLTDRSDTSRSYGQTYSSRGSSDFVRSGTSKTNTNGHTASFEMDWDINKKNYLQITPSFSTNSTTSSSTSVSDNINRYTTGFEHPVNSTINNTVSTAPSYGLVVLYQHIFDKPGRNLSVQSSINYGENKSTRDANNRYRYYADETFNTLLKDSVAHLINRTTNNNTRFRTSITYVEPLSATTRLEFNTQANISKNDNVAISDTVLASGATQQLHRLDNIYNFTFSQYTTSLSYRYTGTKAQVLLGVQAIPLMIDGTKIDQSTGLGVSTSQSYLMIVPKLNFTYAWTRTERLQLNYRPTVDNPNFQYLQPFADRTDPNNVIIGNPSLKPTFNHNLDLTYNNYIANSKLNFSANLTGTATTNQVATNYSQVVTPVDATNPTGPKKSINETRYLNVNGSHSLNGSYSISKQLNDRKYNLSLNGSVSYAYSNAFSNNVAYHTTNWVFDQRFGPRINPTESIEINPYVEYRLNRQFSTTLGATATNLQTTSLAIDGRMYFFKTWQINYSASKNYITGLTAQNTNPLVINAGFEKELGAKRNFVITFNIFDLLHQNTLVQQTVTSTGVTNTLSNTNSRYFMAGIRMNFQKWSGRPQGRNGQQLQRRGDGSFIY